MNVRLIAAVACLLPAIARAQPDACARLATVEEWNGVVDLSWSIDMTTADSRVLALHQASASVRLLGSVIGGRGVFHGRPMGRVIAEETLIELDEPEDVVRIEGAGEDQSTPDQGGVVLEIDLATCEYRVSWPLDLAGATLTSPDQPPMVIPFNIGRMQSMARALGPAEISQSAPFRVYSLLRMPPDAVDSYTVLTPGGIGAVESGGEVAPAAVSWRLVPGPGAEVELVLTATPNDWLPTAGADEDTPGNSVIVEAYLRNRADGSRPPRVRARQITFKIAATSHEPGIALNAPKTDPKATADLQFDPAKNLRRGVPLEVSGEEKDTARIKGAGGMRLFEAASAEVSAFDYGAFGEVTVTAELETGETIQGLVAGIEGETTLLLPRRQGPFVADAWKRRMDVEGLADDDDGETEPPGKRDIAGDGFSLYEEYRGVIVAKRRGHQRLSPKKRDLFIHIDTRDDAVRRGIDELEALTGLAVTQEIEGAELGGSDGRVVNFNHGESTPHAVDQHAIRVEYVEVSPLGYSEAEIRAGAGEIWTPGDSDRVVVRGLRGARQYLDARLRRVRVLNETHIPLRSTVIHEVLHATNVRHHGERDPGFVLWAEVNGTIREQALIADANDMLAPAPGVEPSVITVTLEDDTPVTAAQIGLPLVLWLGTYEQQHSGHETCAMRYDIAKAKKVGFVGNARHWTGREATGLELCEEAAGTGVNDPQRLLTQSLPPRFEDATRGDCAHQIVVNDAAR